ncbi:MAG: YigZ family protein [Mollicutes bacterium]|nr:YigZ family protein [Mollicutes bacterium]
MNSNVYNQEHTLIIKNSKFICLIKSVSNLEEVEHILSQIKHEHKKATHFPYAYIINNNIKKSDDKEPLNTAGLPILNVLQKKELNNILCIVIRYFGGTKLGHGGLIRAYSKAVSESLKKQL